MTGEVGSPSGLLDLLNAAPNWIAAIACGVILALLILAWGRT